MEYIENSNDKISVIEQNKIIIALLEEIRNKLPGDNKVVEAVIEQIPLEESVDEVVVEPIVEVDETVLEPTLEPKIEEVVNQIVEEFVKPRDEPIKSMITVLEGLKIQMDGLNAKFPKRNNSSIIDLVNKRYKK